jgi:hypothetical protein
MIALCLHNLEKRLQEASQVKKENEEKKYK